MIRMRLQALRLFSIAILVSFSVSACSTNSPQAQVKKDSGGWLNRAWTKIYAPVKNYDETHSGYTHQDKGLKPKVVYLDDNGLPENLSQNTSAFKPIVPQKNNSNTHMWKTLNNYDQNNFTMTAESAVQQNAALAKQQTTNTSNTLPWNEVGDLTNIQQINVNDHGFGSDTGVVVFPFEETVTLSSSPAHHQQASSYTAKHQPAQLPIKGVGLAHTVFYKHGQKGLSRIEINRLRALAAQLKAMGNYHIRVIGHSSKTVYNVHNSRIKHMINLDVAMKRASIVSKELIRSGLNPASIETIAWGDSYPNPIQPHKNSPSADRRVEVFLVQR